MFPMRLIKVLERYVIRAVFMDHVKTVYGDGEHCKTGVTSFRHGHVGDAPWRKRAVGAEESMRRTACQHISELWSSLRPCKVAGFLVYRNQLCEVQTSNRTATSMRFIDTQRAVVGQQMELAVHSWADLRHGKQLGNVPANKTTRVYEMDFLKARLIFHREFARHIFQLQLYAAYHDPSIAVLNSEVAFHSIP